MNLKRKDEVVSRANERRGAISNEKGPEYAGQADKYTDLTSDVLANFKRQDKRWGHDSEGLAAAFLYFGKHLDSIETFARELKKTKTKDEAIALVNRGEGIVSRFDDARNYIDLIECLLVDAGIHPEFPTKTLVESLNQTAPTGSGYTGGALS